MVSSSSPGVEVPAIKVGAGSMVSSDGQKTGCRFIFPLTEMCVFNVNVCVLYPTERRSR